MITKEALELIKKSEGLRLYAYLDAVGVWTIGYGHTSAAGAPKVYKGMRITAQEAEDILLADLERVYIPAVTKNVSVPLNPNQLGALVSFVYNLGEANFKKSTLLKKLNKADYKGAAAEFPKWNKAGGKVLKGLVTRRAAEKALFEKPYTVSTEPVIKDYVETAPKVNWLTLLLSALFGRK